MLNKILSNFKFVKDLIAQVEAQKVEIEAKDTELEHEVMLRNIAQDEEEDLRRQIADAHAENIRLHEKLLEQTQKFFDWANCSQGRVPVFGNVFKVDHPPVKLEPKQRVQARTLVADAEKANAANLTTWLNEAEKEMGIN